MATLRAPWTSTASLCCTNEQLYLAGLLLCATHAAAAAATAASAVVRAYHTHYPRALIPPCTTFAQRANRTGYTLPTCCVTLPTCWCCLRTGPLQLQRLQVLALVVTVKSRGGSFISRQWSGFGVNEHATVHKARTVFVHGVLCAARQLLMSPTIPLDDVIRVPVCPSAPTHIRHLKAPSLQMDGRLVRFCDQVRVWQGCTHVHYGVRCVCAAARVLS